MFKEIKATDIKENIVDLLKNNWGLVTAGNNEKYNMMTVSWGAMGELWGKDSVTVKFAPKSSTNCAGGVIEARITNDDLKCVKITADYNDNRTLNDSSIEKISIEDIKQTENTSSHKEFYWESMDNMKPIITEE